MASARDVSPLKRTERKLRRRALHDSLTGLPNRDLLWDRCEQAIERAHRHKQAIAVAYLDLDGFKAVNDSAGHGVGDQVLVEVSERISARIRGEDTIARIGGDEFVILFSEINEADDIHAAVERLREAFERPISVSGKTFEPRASCGVVVVEPLAISRLVDDASLPEAMDRIIDRADEEMYAVKEESGQDCRIVHLSD